MKGKIKDILPQKWFAPRKDDDRFSDLGDLIQDLKGLVGIQFARIRAPLG
jgi:hypothetical protein